MNLKATSEIGMCLMFVVVTHHGFTNIGTYASHFADAGVAQGILRQRGHT